MSTEDVTAEIAAVLAEHRVSHHGTTIVGFTPCRCSCGVDFACPVFQSWEFCDYYHRAHLADALANLLAARDRRVRAEALREAAAAMGGIGSHRDPCRLPDTPCLCGLCDDRKAASDWLCDRADRYEGDA